VLAIAPHPDDEAWAMGAALARAARGGAEVTVAVMTRGEAGLDRLGRVAPGPALGALRAEELAASCAALGAGPPRHLDLPDGARPWGATATERLGALVAEVAPDVVVTLGPDGAYGHRDHTRTAHVVTALLGDQPAQSGPRLLRAVWPRGLFDPLWRALRAGPGATLLDPAIDPPLGSPPSADHIVVRVDGPAAEAKLAALAAHRSQLRGGDPMTLLPRRILASLLVEERYEVAAGPAPPPGADDLLAGL